MNANWYIDTGGIGQAGFISLFLGILLPALVSIVLLTPGVFRRRKRATSEATASEVAFPVSLTPLGRQERASLPSEQEIEEYMRREFPECPICMSIDGYEVDKYYSFEIVVECRSCGAKWGSLQFSDLKPMEEITLRAAPHDGYVKLEHRSKPASFWKRVGRLASEGEREMSLTSGIFKYISFFEGEKPILSLGAEWYAVKVWNFVGEDRDAAKIAGTFGLLSPILTNKRIIFLKYDEIRFWELRSSRLVVDSDMPLDEVESAASTGTRISHLEVRRKNGGSFLLFFIKAEKSEGSPIYFVKNNPKISNRWAKAINNAIAQT
jgi:hypothetical protein